MSVAKVEEAVNLAPDSPTLLQQLRRNLFDSHLLLATALLNQDDLTDARQHYQKAWDTTVDLSSESAALWRRLAGGLKQLGDKHKAAGRYAAALEAYNRARWARDILARPTNWARLPNYNVQDAKQDVAIAHREIGYLELALGDKKRALVAFGESRQKANELVLESPSVGLYRRTLAYAYEGLGKSYQANEEPERAEAAYERQREAITEAIILLKDAGFQDNLAVVSKTLGSLRIEQRRFKEAVEAYTETVAVRRELHRVMQDLVKDGKRKEADLRVAETNLADSLGGLAYAELFNGSPDKTVQHSLEAQRFDPGALWLKTNLAHGYLFTKQYAMAEEIYVGYKNEKAFRRPDSETFRQAVLDDFVKLRKLNAALPDLDKEAKRIERLLGDGAAR
jgi:tetratricopeptide (TPR) repeat protein